MADRKLQYIIEMIADDSQIRKQMKGWDWADIMGTAGKSFGDMMGDEAKYGADEIKRAFKGLNVDWTQILGTKEIGQLEQALARSLQKNKIAIQDMANKKDAQGIQNTIDLMVELGKEFQQIGSNFDAGQIARSLRSFVTALQTDKIAKFVTDTEVLVGTLDKVFNGKVLSGASQINNTLGQVTQGFIVVGEEAGKAAVAVNKSIEDMEGKLASINALFDKDYTIKFKADLESQFYDIDEEIEGVEKKIQKLTKDFDKMKISDENFVSTRDALVEAHRKRAELYRALDLIDQKYVSKNSKDDSLLVLNDIIPSDAINKSRDKISTILNDAKLQLEEFSKSTKTTKDGINIPIKLPTQAELVKVINQYIDGINETKAIHGIKVNIDGIDDVANVIENQTKRAYKDNPADDDASTTELVNKTATRFDKVTEVIEEKQENILKKTEGWRKKMLDQLKFKNGDFEFSFGDSLFESLQSYLNEQGNELKFVVDQETIKEQLKMVIENSGLTLGGFGGGTVTINPSDIARAVYEGMQAAVNGQPLPSFDTRSNGDSSKEETESIADIVNSSDKYVKTITEKTINSERVIEALRDFAKAAATQKGAGRQNVARWLTDRGIDMDAIYNGASDEAIRTMLNEALMVKDKFGYAKGSTFADILSDLKRFGINGGKQENDVLAFKGEIIEMLNRMGINQEYWQESQRRYQSYESYESAAKYGRPIATLSRVRTPLKANSMKNFVDGGYQRLTDDKYIGNLDASIEYIDALQSEYLTGANQEINSVQQKALKLKEEFTELDKKSAEAKERLDKATAEYNRLKGIPEDQRTKQDNANIIKIKKEFDEASNQYAWTKRDSEAKKKEYLRLVTYTDKDGKRHVGTIDQMKERLDAQQSVYTEAKSQITSFRDSILGLGENPAEESIKALEQVARNFFEQSGKMMQNLFKNYGDMDTFQGRVTLQNGRTVDIKSPYDFLGFTNDEVADVDIYNDILMKRWEKSKSVKKGVPQDFERPNYYVNRPQSPLDIENERVDDKGFTPIDAPKTPNLTNSIKGVESNIQQLSEEKKQASEKLAELNKVIESKEQEAGRLSELVGALTETEKATLSKEAEKAQKKIVEKQNKASVEQQEINRIDAEIFSTESAISAMSQLNVGSEIEERHNNLTRRINDLKSNKEDLSQHHVMAYDAYNEALTQYESAKKAYEDYINKLVDDALLEEQQSGNIQKLAEERGISQLEAVGIRRKALYRDFNLSGRADIKALRDEETRTYNDKNVKEENYKRIKGSMESIDTLVSQLEQERDNLTVEALQAEKDAAIQRHQTALAELRHQKKLAEQRLARATQAEQGASDVLSNNVVLQQMEAERELNALRGQRERLVGNIESSDSQITTNQQTKERLELQSQYNQLKEKELILQREIAQLEDGEVKTSKQSELNETSTKLQDLETKITALGGSVNRVPQKEYAESDKKSDALRQAKDIQNRLMIAKAQQRAFAKDVADIEKLEQNVRAGGLTSTIGARELNKFKFAATVDFKQSDYYQGVRNQKKDNLEKELEKYSKEQSEIVQEKIKQINENIRNQVINKEAEKRNIDLEAIRKNDGQKAYDKAVKKIAEDRNSEIKRKQAAAVEEYRHSEEFQKMSDEATANIESKKRELWTALDDEMSQLVKEYINAIKSDKGKVSMSDDKFKSIFSDFIANSEYSLSDSNEVDLKQLVLDRLAEMKKVAQGKGEDSEQQAYIRNLPALINTLEQSLAEALRYGGFEYSDLANKREVEEIIQKTASVESNKAERQRQEGYLADAINELEEAKKQNLDLKPFKDNIKAIKAEIAQLDEVIDREESQIENAKDLLELKTEEKAASKPLLSDQLGKTEDRLKRSKENLATVKNEITELEKIARETEAKYGKDSAEAERARLNLLYKQRAQATLERNIGWDEKRVARWSAKVGATNSSVPTTTATTTSSQGGIFSGVISEMQAIASSMGTIDVDNSDIATETTLRAIFELLSGGGQASADLDAQKALLKEERDARRKEEQARVIAESKKQQSRSDTQKEESKKQSKSAQAKSKLNTEGQTKFRAIQAEGRKAYSELANSDEKTIIQKIQDKAKQFEGLTKGTEEYLKAQYELSNMVFAYTNKLQASGVTSKTKKNGQKYLDYKDVLEREEIKAIGDIESLMLPSNNAIADGLVKLGFGAKLSRNKKDPTDLDINPSVDMAQEIERKLIEKFGKSIDLKEIQRIVGDTASKVLIAIGDEGKSVDREQFYTQYYDRIFKNAYVDAEGKLFRQNENQSEDINSLDDKTLVDKFKHLMQLLTENKATEAQKSELNQITDLLKSKGLIKDHSKQETVESEQQLENEKAKTAESEKQLENEKKRGHQRVKKVDAIAQDSKKMDEVMASVEDDLQKYKDEQKKVVRTKMAQTVYDVSRGQIPVDEGLSRFIHGTNKASAKNIANTGLDFSAYDILESMVVDDEATFLHKDTRFATVLDIPKKYVQTYMRGVLTTVNKAFVKGYINAMTGEFVANPEFNPDYDLTNELQVKMQELQESEKNAPKRKRPGVASYGKKSSDIQLELDRIKAFEVSVEPKMTSGAVAEEVKENVAEVPAEAQVEPTADNDVYKRAVETVRGAIGNFSMRSGNTKKADKYNSFGQEVKDAGNIIYKNLENATKEEKALYEKLKKLRDAASNIQSQQIADNLVADTSDKSTALDSLDDEALTNKFLELDELRKNDAITESQIMELRDVINLIVARGLNVEDDDVESEEVTTAINNLSEKVAASDEDVHPTTTSISGTSSSSTPQGGIIGAINNLAKESTLGKVLTALGEIAKKNALANSGKQNSAQDLLEQFRRMLESDAWEGKERVAYVDLETGSMSNSITGDEKEITTERLGILRAAYKDVMDLNAQVHTHANEEDPYFSKEDLSLFASDFTEGITKQILLSKNNMTVLDMVDVKDVNGLLEALAQTEHNFEALAETASKFGAKYVSKAFNEITPQGLVKMLGIKGIESKYTETETRDSAIEGVIAEEAKEAAKVIQESTGRAVKTTRERVGAEWLISTEKIDTKGNKTWSKQYDDTYTKAALATKTAFDKLELANQFGEGTEASIALDDYIAKFTRFTELVEQFRQNPKQEGLQEEFNKLLPELDDAEKKLNKLIVTKDKFIGNKEPVTIFNKDQVDASGTSLKALATQQFAGISDNMAFNGISETPNGTRLIVDVLKNGFIQQYALEVDKATGQVREFMMAETALVNAFQNVNKVMKQNELVMADVVSPDIQNEEQLQEFLANAKSPMWDAYKTSLAEMQKYTVDLLTIMKNGGSVSKEQEDYLLSLSEKVLRLGRELQKTSGAFSNFWAQNPDSVSQLDFTYNPNDRDTEVRAQLEAEAKRRANVANSEYEFSSFDNDTLQYTLTDLEGNITKVTLVWNELYKQVATVSDKSVSAIDPMVAKINKYDEALQQAVKDGYLMADDKNLQGFNNSIQLIEWLIKGIQDGTETFDTAKEKLAEYRKEAVKFGADAIKTSKANEKLYTGTNELRSAGRQRDRIVGIFGDGFEESNLSGVQQYKQEYQGLLDLYNRLNTEKKLYDTNEQENLRQQAIRVQAIGSRLLTSVKQAEELKRLADESGTYEDGRGNLIKLGGVSEPLAEQANTVKGLKTAMIDYVQNGLGIAGLEHIKFNNRTKQLTGEIRTSKDTVAEIVVQYNEATRALYAYNKAEKESLTGWRGVIQGFKAKLGSIMQYTASITSIYRVFSELKRGIQYIREIDSALTELKKVTDETDESYERFLNTAAKTAGKVGSTIKEIVSSTADWARIGYNLQDAATLAESTAILLNVSEFQSIDDATSALTSTLQAFGYTADQSMYVVDVLNEVGELVARR